MIDDRTVGVLRQALDRLATNIEKAAPVLDRRGSKALLNKMERDMAFAQAALRIVEADDDRDPLTAMAIEIGKSDVRRAAR